MDRMNFQFTPTNANAPIFSPKPQSQPLELNKSTDPFDELLKKEMVDESSPNSLSEGDIPDTPNWENEYRNKLSSMTLDELKEERKRLTDEINSLVEAGDVSSLKEAQRKYDIVTRVIRERIFSEVNLAKAPKEEVVAEAPKPSTDDIRKQLQQMDITVPTSQENPPTVPPQEENVYAEPSVYQEGVNNNSNVRILSVNTSQVTSQLPAQPPQPLTPNPNGLGGMPAPTMNYQGLQGLNNLMGMSGLNMNMMNSLASQAQLTQLMSSLAGANMGMGGFGLLGQNRGPLGDIYKAMFVNGSLFPQNMSDLGAILALDVNGLFGSDKSDDE